MIRWPLLFPLKEYAQMADQPARLEAATLKAEIGSGIVYRFSNDAATEDDIPTLSGEIPNLKKVILRIQNDGAEKISFATKIFITTAAGIAGTSNQEIFLVQSNDPGEIYEVWQNVSGTAVDTGKRSISASAVIEATEAATAAAASAQESADAATIKVARFLEPSATPPIQRDDGQPLQFGDRYLNTTDQIEYIYKASGWVANNLDSQTLAEKEGATLIGAELPDGSLGTVQSLFDGFTSVEVQNVLGLLTLDKSRIKFAHTSSYSVAGDNGGGFYFLDASDSTTAADGYLCIVANDGGRWKLNRNEHVALVEQAGARPSIADNTAAIQKVLNAAGSRWVSSCGGTFFVKSLLVNSGQNIQDLRFKTIGGSEDFVAPITIDGRTERKVNIHLRDVYIDGNRQNQLAIDSPAEDGGRSGVRLIGRGTNITFERVSAVYCGSQGFNIFSVTPAVNDTTYNFDNIRHIDCEAHFNRQHGFVFDGATNITYRGCRANNNGGDLDTTSPLNSGMRGARSDNGLMYGRPITAEDYGIGFAYRGVLIDDFRGASNMAGILFHVFTDVNSVGFVPRGNITLQDVVISDVNSNVDNPAISCYNPSATVDKPAFMDINYINCDFGGWAYFHGVRDATVISKMLPTHASGKCVVSEVSSGIRVDAGKHGTASVTYDVFPMVVSASAPGTVRSITNTVLSTYPRLVVRSDMIAGASGSGTMIFRFQAPSGRVIQPLRSQSVNDGSGAPLPCFSVITGSNEVSNYVTSPGVVDIRSMVDIEEVRV
jgi:hypothetical protein